MRARERHCWAYTRHSVALTMIIRTEERKQKRMQTLSLRLGHRRSDTPLYSSEEIVIIPKHYYLICIITFHNTNGCGACPLRPLQTGHRHSVCATTCAEQAHGTKYREDMNEMVLFILVYFAAVASAKIPDLDLALSKIEITPNNTIQVSSQLLIELNSNRY